MMALHRPVMVSAAILVFCGIAQLTTASAADPIKVRFIADELGFFKEADVQVEIFRMANGAALTTALATDQLDVAGISVAPAVYSAIQQGLNIRIVGDKQSRKPGISATQFVVRPALVKASKDETIRGLKGKTIGVSSQRSVSFMQVENLLQLYGLPATEMKYVTLEYHNMVPALASGTIDGAQIIEPFLTRAIEDKSATIVSDMIEARGDIGTATTVPLIYSEKFASNRKAGVAFMIAYMKGVRVYVDALEKHKNQQQVYAILAKRASLPVDLVAKMHLPYLDPNQRIEPAAFEEVQKYYLEKRWLRTPVDIAKLVDTSFAKEAVASLGEYK
jgi:NitT/TauT family transport system substrate-binding protein